MPSSAPPNSGSGPRGSAFRENKKSGGATPHFYDTLLLSSARASGLDGCVSSDNDANPQAAVTAALKDDKLKPYVIAKARPPREKPPWAIPDGQEPPLFLHLQTFNKHPFRFNENLVNLISADKFISTEVQGALIERGYLDPHDLTDNELKLAEVNVTSCKDFKMISGYIKSIFGREKLFFY